MNLPRTYRHWAAMSAACYLWLSACSDEATTQSNPGGAGSAGSTQNTGGTAGSGGSDTTGAIVQFIGSPTFAKVDWTSGQKLQINVAGGKIRIGPTAAVAITVNTANPPAECGSGLCVRFLPIVAMSPQNQEGANQQMKTTAEGGHLDLKAAQEGGIATVAVSVSGSASSYDESLSAVVDVWLPQGFDGDIAATAESGEISLSGVRRGATAKTGLGNVNVKLEAISPGASSGEIQTQLGDVLFSAPKSANISIQGQSDATGEVLISPGISGWQMVEGSTAQAATFCGNTACQGQSEGNWSLKSEFGSVQITLE